MRTLSVGKLWLRPPCCLLVLVILMGIPLVSSSLGAQSQRNTPSKNVWRRQSPLPSNEEAAPHNLWRRQLPQVDDAAVAPSPDAHPTGTNDIQNANPAENEINVGGNAVGRQGGAGPSPVSGLCHLCLRHKDSKNKMPCLDAPDKMWLENNVGHGPCSGYPDNFVRCLTFIMKMRGTRLPEKSRLTDADKEDRRIDGRTCAVGKQGRLVDCALDILDMKLEDGKCVKGTYPISLIEKVSECMHPFNTFFPIPFDDLKDDKSTAPEPGKSPSTADHGLFWGEYGRVQYAELTLCLCKQKPQDPAVPALPITCNDKLAKDLLKNTVEVATKARKLPTGILRWLPI